MPDITAVRHVLGPASTTRPSHHSFPHTATSPPPALHPGPTVVWFRGHDLRVHDHAALDAAVASKRPIVALYVLERGAETDGVSSYTRRLAEVSNHFSDTTPVSNSPPQTPSPLSPNGGFALGRVQRWYLHHSLSALREQLLRLGITLALRRVDCADDTAPVVTAFARAVGAARVFWNKRYKPRAYPVEDAVRSGLADLQVVAHDFDSETLLPPYKTGQGRYDDFQSYTRFWIDLMRDHPPPRPRPPLNPQNVDALSRDQVEALLAQSSPIGDSRPKPSRHRICSPLFQPLPSVHDLELLYGLKVDGDDSPGSVSTIGCKAAERTLSNFLKDEHFRRYSSGGARRDGMVTGKDLATSRLSPHVRFGEISPRVLFYAVVDAGARAKQEGNTQGLEAARTFLKNMSLREFGYYMLGRYPSAACKPIMPEFEVFPWDYDKDGAMTKAWETGTTGFPIVDAAMRQLIREGWIHNRMRFLAASFFCKYLLLPWPVGAAHMVRTLVDGDEACNSLGWQWTAGCNSDSFPFSTLVNPLSLFNHTQSKKRAAAYVRKYVPELAGLPDSLVFTPWKATAEERRLYRLSLVPLDEFRRIKSQMRETLSGYSHTLYFYPERVVNGPQARNRARNAMEVMRRIFSAQRRCRTIIVDQTSTASGMLLITESRPSSESLDDAKRECMDIEIADEQMSSVTKTNTSPQQKTRGTSTQKAAPAKVFESPMKKQRLRGGKVKATKSAVTCSDLTDVISTSNSRNASSPISRGEVDLLLSSRQNNDQKSNRRLRRPASEVTTVPEQSGAGTTKESRNSPESVAKRPRSSGSQSPPSADGRVSVLALLTPTMQDPTKAGVRQKRVPPELPAVPVDMRQAQNSSFQRAGSSQLQSQADTEQNSPNQFAQRQPAALHVPSPLSFRSNYAKPAAEGFAQQGQELSSPILAHPSVPALNSYVDRTNQQYSRTQPASFRSPPAVASLRQGSPDGLHKPRQTEMGTFRRPDMMSGTHAPVEAASLHPNALRNSHVPHHPGFGSGRVPGGAVYQHGIQQVPIMANHLQNAQPHNAQVMLPFRPGGPMPVTQIGHQTGAIPRQDGMQRYFPAMPQLNAQHSGPVFFYPGVPQYFDMRGLPETPVPQLLHPMVTPHPAALPIGYSGPPGGATGVGPNNGRVAQPSAAQGQISDRDAGARRGPSTPMEREEIARRMAAMDYYDDAYGGKHWEQWQAIALHLLEQYEFSEDTDRDTSKAYVRLCVLKDELRDANPTGPRVTVNHCKEVFRILRLPVTGEWDRRGHGGVRGPYCYGCVKRSGAQVSKK